MHNNRNLHFENIYYAVNISVQTLFFVRNAAKDQQVYLGENFQTNVQIAGALPYMGTHTEMLSGQQ